MAGRPQMDQLKFSSWDVDMFDNDTDIDELLDAQGSAGFFIYFYLCQKAYGSNGYYYQWNCSNAATTARKAGAGFGSETVINTVNLCLRIGLFSKDLYDRHEILTSRRIQEQFLEVKKKREGPIYLIEEFFLIENDDLDEKTWGRLDFHTLKLNNTQGKLNNTQWKLNNDIPKGKRSKGKESKEKESRVKEIKESSVSPAKAVDTPKYPPGAFEIQCVERLIRSCVEVFPNSKVPVSDKEKCGWADEVERMKRLDKRSEEEIWEALEYAVTDSFWKSNIRSIKKLREKLETLLIQKRSRAGNGRNRNQSVEEDYFMKIIREGEMKNGET